MTALACLNRHISETSVRRREDTCFVALWISSFSRTRPPLSSLRTHYTNSYRSMRKGSDARGKKTSFAY